jgi:hypothetical protein
VCLTQAECTLSKLLEMALKRPHALFAVAMCDLLLEQLTALQFTRPPSRPEPYYTARAHDLSSWELQQSCLAAVLYQSALMVH